LTDIFNHTRDTLIDWLREAGSTARVQVYTSNNFKTQVDLRDPHRVQLTGPAPSMSDWQPLLAGMGGAQGLQTQHFPNPDLRAQFRHRRGDCIELEQSDGSFLLLPPFFWDEIADPPPQHNPRAPHNLIPPNEDAYFWAAHPMFPGLMLSHALLRSGFSS
jgi:hypothetical protein